MSRTRIVGGTITKKTGGNHSIYTDGNIVQNAGKAIKETSDKGVTHDKPKNPPPAPLLKKYFVDGWWSLDKEGKNKIKRALPGMKIYFHLKTKNIPNGESVFLSLFDEDNHEKEEPQNRNSKKDKDDAIKLVNTKSKKEVLVAKVNNGKAVQKIELTNLDSFTNDEQDKCLELYFRCSYKIENVQFPNNAKEYLKVGAIVIDRYKMPGLNAAGTDIADDMTYGYGFKHQGTIYDSSLLENYKKEYKTSGFNTEKHNIFSNAHNLPNKPLIKGDPKTNSADKDKYRAVQDNLKVITPEPIKILNSNIAIENRSNKAIYSKNEILNLGYLMKFSNMTDFRLWFNFRTLKALLAWGKLSSLLDEMIDKFQRNEGGIYENRVLTQSIQENANTIAYCEKIEDYIAEQLKTNFNKLEEVEDLEPYFEDHNKDMRNTKGKRKDLGKEFSRPAFSYWDSNNFSGNLFSGKTLSLNDIWSTEVLLKQVQFNEDNYTAKYQITLWDHFGLDKPDLEKFYYNINGFRAWFLLQHTQGYKPFITKITFVQEFKGNINKGKAEKKAERQKIKDNAAQKEREKALLLRDALKGPKF